MKICRNYIITGRVQGVFFRDKTRKLAQSLNISGYVKNMANGGVEVIACGEEGSLQQLEQWLHKGPVFARVNEVTSTQVDWQEFDTFTTE